jgi:hypothetical protein
LVLFGEIAITAKNSAEWDQRHTLKADVLLLLPWRIAANVLWQFHTGRPYTFYPSKDGFTPENPKQLFLPNNRRMARNQTLDLYVSKELFFQGRAGGEIGAAPKLTVYLDARNLLDRLNVRWVDSSGRVGGELGDPSAFYSPRRTSLGFSVTF